jgi:pimeloyl-ACP methyl ester carboxylesterase
MWKEHILPTADLQLAWYEAGDGSIVVFLHGGPGDDHSYLRPLAEPIGRQFRCVLYDQRGSGHSHLGELHEETLHINRFFEDLEALRLHLNQPRLRLVGHSWGATLALLYAIGFPDRIERMALIGLGPLNDDLAAVASANLLQPLSRSEREEFERLSTERRLARESGDLQKHRQLHIQLVTEYYARSWFYSPEAAERFRTQYQAMYSHNPLVATYLLPSVRAMQDQVWQRLPQIKTPVLILYGYQDCQLTPSLRQGLVSVLHRNSA